MVDHLRTLGIVAHIDAGKTTLTERILFACGVQRFCGEVDEGTATMDWLRQEQERGISIVAAATRVSWRAHDLQIVDTPGHVDFTAEVERCMRVLDSVVVVLDAVRGVESQTQTVWRQADRWRQARVVFVNKMDRVGADFAAAQAALRAHFGCRPAPVSIPLFDAAGSFAGIGDPIRGTATWFEGDVPAELHTRLASDLRRAHDELVETVAEVDDGILAAFVEGRGVAPEHLLAALRRGCIASELVPVLAGAALHGRGVDALLDAICELLPSPRDRDRTGLGDAFPAADPDAPFCGLVFKVEHEGGEVRNYVRVFTGELAPGDRVQVARSGLEITVGEVWAMHASHHAVVERAGPGTIVVLPGPGPFTTGDTVRAVGATRVLPMPSFPPPVLGAVLEPATEGGEPLLQRALAELLADDPTLQATRDVESGLPLVLGMGELHLEIVAARIRERVAVPFQLSRPRVARHATVARAAAGRATVRSPGESPRTAEAEVRIRPQPGAVEVAAAGAFVHQVEEQVRALLESGDLLGGPAADVRVAVEARCASEALGVRGHSADAAADDALVAQAVAIALDKAVAAAGRIALEPEVEFEVRCPAEHRSAVLADLQARGAAMRSVSAGQMGARMVGRGRLQAFLGYTTRLRSLTRGHGEVQLRPHGLVPVDASEGPAAPQI